MDNDMSQIESLLQGKKFDEILLILSDVEKKRKLSLAELVLRGTSIQLASGIGTPPLSEAAEAFTAALEEDRDYVPALLELGWFYYAVQDEAGKGLPFFERALTTSLQQLRETIKG